MSILTAILENIFPERDDHRIVASLEAADLLARMHPSAQSGFVSLLPFSEPAVRAVVHEAKFHHNEKAWRLLAEVLASYLKHCPSGALLLPIPLSAKRKRKRGYNQVAEVAKLALPAAPHILWRDDILARRRHTAPQTSLARKERLTNVADAFGVRRPDAIGGQDLIVLDDVATTGATLEAARASLAMLHPASVTLLSLAH